MAAGPHLQVRPRTNGFSGELSHEAYCEHTLPKANIWRSLSACPGQRPRPRGGGARTSAGARLDKRRARLKPDHGSSGGPGPTAHCTRQDRGDGPFSQQRQAALPGGHPEAGGARYQLREEETWVSHSRPRPVCFLRQGLTGGY